MASQRLVVQVPPAQADGDHPENSSAAIPVKKFGRNQRCSCYTAAAGSSTLQEGVTRAQAHLATLFPFFFEANRAFITKIWPTQAG